MDSFSMIGRWMVIAGLAIAVIGGLVWLIGKIPGVNNLPGTIRIQGSGFTCVIPLLGSIVLSILLTVVLNIVVRLINK